MPRVKYWEGRWSWGCVSAIDSNGRANRTKVISETSETLRNFVVYSSPTSHGPEGRRFSPIFVFMFARAVMIYYNRPDTATDFHSRNSALRAANLRVTS